MEDKSHGFQFEPVPLNQLAQVADFRSQEVRLKRKARLSWNTAALEFTEAVVCRCFSKQVFLNISQYSQCRSLFSIMLQPWRPTTLSKWGSYIGGFPWIFLRTAFYRTPLMAASGFLAKLAENDCEENHFPVVFLRNFLEMIF